MEKLLCLEVWSFHYKDCHHRSRMMRVSRDVFCAWLSDGKMLFRRRRLCWLNLRVMAGIFSGETLEPILQKYLQGRSRLPYSFHGENLKFSLFWHEVSRHRIPKPAVQQHHLLSNNNLPRTLLYDFIHY